MLREENSRKKLKSQRKIPPAQDWGLYKRTTPPIHLRRGFGGQAGGGGKLTS